MTTALTKSKKAMPRRAVSRSGFSVRAVDEFPIEISLSSRDSRQFLRHLNNPPKPNQKLKDAVARYKKTAGGND